MWFTSRVMLFSDYFCTGFEFAIIVNKAENKPQGTLFRLGTWQILKIDTLEISSARSIQSEIDSIIELIH